MLCNCFQSVQNYWKYGMKCINMAWYDQHQKRVHCFWRRLKRYFWLKALSNDTHREDSLLWLYVKYFIFRLIFRHFWKKVTKLYGFVFFYDEFHFSMNSTIDAYNIMFMPQSENNQISNPFQAVSVPYPQTIRMCPVIAAHHKMRQEKHRAGINGKEPSWI